RERSGRCIRPLPFSRTTSRYGLIVVTFAAIVAVAFAVALPIGVAVTVAVALLTGVAVALAVTVLTGVDVGVAVATVVAGVVVFVVGVPVHPLESIAHAIIRTRMAIGIAIRDIGTTTAST